MKSVWATLAVFSLPGLAYGLWLAHVITFGMADISFESDPPEGWEYWMMREAREDLIRFILYSLVPASIFGFFVLKAVRPEKERSHP